MLNGGQLLHDFKVGAANMFQIDTNWLDIAEELRRIVDSTVRTSKKQCCLPIIVQASRSKGVYLLAQLCFFWFNVWTFMRSP